MKAQESEPLKNPKPAPLLLLVFHCGLADPKASYYKRIERQMPDRLRPTSDLGNLALECHARKQYKPASPAFAALPESVGSPVFDTVQTRLQVTPINFLQLGLDRLC